jgi:archaellum component FlaC
MNTNTVYLIDKFSSACYWLGRANEALDNEDIDGTISCMNFFRAANNCLLRVTSENEAINNRIQDLQDKYNELYNEYLEIRNGNKDLV